MTNDRIVIYPGTYNEQIIIPAGKNNLLIESQSGNPTDTIIAPTVLVPATGAVITVAGADCVQINNLTVRGPSIPFEGRIGRDINVIGGGSAIITSNILTFDTTFPRTGLQTGNGINVEAGSSALIVDNTISEYQKTGIRINSGVAGNEACGIVLNNTLNGGGNTNGLIAINGIQIGRGVTALVQGNTVTGHVYNGVDPLSVGILSFDQTGQDVCIMDNIVQGNDIGVELFNATGILIQANNITNNLFYGTFVLPDAVANVFIRNIAVNNPTFDMADFSAGLLSAMTANIYLCNTCETDNRGGAICASTSALASLPVTTDNILTTFILHSPMILPNKSPE